MKAIKVIAPGEAKVVADAARPRLRPDYILIEPKAWAVSPTDYSHTAALAEPGTTIGVDLAGIVVEVSEGVTDFKPGDKVIGATHGGNNAEPEDGAFGEIAACKAGAVLKKPKTLKWEEAVTMGGALATVGQTLVYTMGLDENNAKGKTALVYGGSSSTGTFMIQVLKL
jgi:NADPH:quinone reductase-like Zn-dependent oxidoreductase